MTMIAAMPMVNRVAKCQGNLVREFFFQGQGIVKDFLTLSTEFSLSPILE